MCAAASAQHLDRAAGGVDKCPTSIGETHIARSIDRRQLERAVVGEPARNNDVGGARIVVTFRAQDRARACCYCPVKGVVEAIEDESTLGVERRIDYAGGNELPL